VGSWGQALFLAYLIFLGGSDFAERMQALVEQDVGSWGQALFLAYLIFLGGSDFAERMQALVEQDVNKIKDIPRVQRRVQAKPIDYCLKRNKDRDAGIREASLRANTA
jgi:hypothetical protein